MGVKDIFRKLYLFLLYGSNLMLSTEFWTSESPIELEFNTGKRGKNVPKLLKYFKGKETVYSKV